MKKSKLFEQFIDIDRAVAAYSYTREGRSDVLIIHKIRELLKEIIEHINDVMIVEKVFEK